MSRGDGIESTEDTLQKRLSSLFMTLGRLEVVNIEYIEDSRIGERKLVTSLEVLSMEALGSLLQSYHGMYACNKAGGFQC